MESDRRDNTELSQICEDLGVTPAQMREIISSFGDLIGVKERQPAHLDGEGVEEPWRDLLTDGDQQDDVDLAQGIPSESAGLIRDILRMRNEGLSEGDIRKALKKQGAEFEDVDNRLESRLDRLVQEIDLSERRRAEDRDRLLTALMRTHQEVRQLRNEIAAQNSRRARKKSFLARLLGL